MPARDVFSDKTRAKNTLFNGFFVSLNMSTKYSARRETAGHSIRGPRWRLLRTLTTATAMLAAAVFMLSCSSPAPAPASASAEGLNTSPVIRHLTANDMTSTTLVRPGGGIELFCMATDIDADVLTYNWSASEGKLKGDGDTVLWIAPESEGQYPLTVTVEDGKGGSATATITIRVTDSPSEPPVISAVRCIGCTEGIEASRWSTYELKCEASDPEEGPLRYIWFASTGKIEGNGPSASWITSGQYGNALVTVIVSDEDGNETKGYLAINISCCH